MVTSEDFEWWEANVQYDADRERETVEVDVTKFGGEPETITFAIDNDAYRRDFPAMDDYDYGVVDESGEVQDEAEWENEGGAIR